MTLLLVTIAFLGVSSPAPVSPTPLKCPSVKIDRDFLWWRLGPSVAKAGPPPGGTARTFLSYKDNWLRDCPRNETVWYAVLRAGELTSPDGKAPADLIEAARTAVPGSVWIETVRARALGTVEAAEAAIRLAPKHIPAQVALATAREREADHESAFRILRPIRDLHRVVGGPLLLARVALAMGDAKLAAESALREPDREGGIIEPVSSRLLVGEARLLEGDARLQLGQADKALSAYLVADFWRSAAAAERLRSPTAELKRAMAARLKKSGIVDDQRERLLEYLHAHRLGAGEIGKHPNPSAPQAKDSPLPRNW